MARTKVFLSYAHEDGKWRSDLEVHLKALVREGLIDYWDDKRLRTGTNWRAEIDRQLLRARIALLLVSPNFLASDFIQDKEVPAIFKRHAKAGMEVFPLIVEPCLWKRSNWISALQVRPAEGRALASLDPPRAKEELLAAAEEVAHIAEAVGKKKSPPSKPLNTDIRKRVAKRPGRSAG